MVANMVFNFSDFYVKPNYNIDFLMEVRKNDLHEITRVVFYRSFTMQVLAKFPKNLVISPKDILKSKDYQLKPFDTDANVGVFNISKAIYNYRALYISYLESNNNDKIYAIFYPIYLSTTDLVLKSWLKKILIFIKPNSELKKTEIHKPQLELNK